MPSLVIHGDADQLVPLAGSGRRTHDALAGSRLHVIAGGPHGIPISHTAEFNDALLSCLGDDVAADRAAPAVSGTASG